MVKNGTTEENAAGDNDIESLIALLDVIDAMPGAAQLRYRSYELLCAGSGRTVVDVGCGSGRAVAELADSGAHALGIDNDARMVAAARLRWPTRTFRVADAYDLPLGDGTVAGYRAEKMLHELNDPARAIEEARRVLAPNGRIVLIGQDWDTFVIESGDAELTRAIVHARADMVPGPRTARRYRNLLLGAGFQDVAVEVRTAVFTDSAMLPMLAGLAEAASTVGAIEREKADAWIAEQWERGAAGRLFLAVPVFVASGTKSGTSGK